ITYNKTALWMHTLERMLGWETMRRSLSTYFQRYAFAHPGPEDFFAVVHEVSAQDLTWFFDQVHRSASVFDYSVDVLRSAAAPPREGPLAHSSDEHIDSAQYRTTVVVR